MKFKVTMKDPDGVSDALDEAIEREVALMTDAEEREAVAEVKRRKVGEVMGKWFEYGEYLTVEIDTEAGTCVVVPK